MFEAVSWPFLQQKNEPKSFCGEMLAQKVVWSYFTQMTLLITTDDTLALMTQHSNRKEKSLQKEKCGQEKKFLKFMAVLLTFPIQGILTYSSGCFYF